MIDHVSTYAADYLATKAFYDATLPTLGFPLVREISFENDPDLPGRRACSYGPSDKPVFWVIEARQTATPRHIAFAAESREAVAAFHRAGLTAGGGDLGAPGLRPVYHEHYFGSFLTDPDGNNVEAVCHSPEG